MECKNNIKMFLIGLIVCAVVFFLIGATNQNTQANRYQISSFSAASGTQTVRGWYGYYVVDTYTGEVVDWKVMQQSHK